MVAQDTRRIDQIRVEGLERVNEEVVIQSMVTSVGEPLNISTLDLDMRRIYGRGDFEHNAALLVFDRRSRMVRIFDLAEQQLAFNYARHLARGPR